MRKYGLLFASLSWLIFAASMASQGAFQKPKLDFSRDVLPILSDKCFNCHGPDATSRKADLRLDTREGALQHAIVPGKSLESLLVQRITSKDDPMPPAASGKVLSQGEIKILTRWIEEGATYAKLWSFEPLAKSIPVPKVSGTWPLDDLDRFVLDRLNREKMKPSPAADPLRWLRRVTLDLTGLPPTEQEIADFQKEKNYEKVVDRLLASPHYGERLAVEWLDAARYSDSYGYQSDLLMPSWPYRDWVVNAFNRNLPYNLFLTEQIAGDLIPNATRDQRLATAFNRLHRQSNEGGSIALEFKTEYAVDRVDTYGTAVLGLTLGCARCHDHKFDPISQKEYYQLFAYFNSIDEYGLLLSTEIVPTPSLLLPTPEQEAKLKELQEMNRQAKSALRTTEAEARERFIKFLASPENTGLTGCAKEARQTLIPAAKGQFSLDREDELAKQKIGTVEVVDGVKGKGVKLSGDNGLVFRGLPAKERWEPFTWSFLLSDPRQTGPVVLLHRTGGTDVGFCGFDLMLEDGYVTARVFRHWPGNAVGVRTKTQIPKDKWTHLTWSWDGSGEAPGLKLYIDGVQAETTILADKIWKKINAYGDLGPSGGDWSFGQRFRDAGFKGGILDEIEFFDRAISPFEAESRFTGKPITPESKGFLGTFVALDSEVVKAREAVHKAQQELANFEEGIREISVMEESTKEIPAYLLARGQYDAPRTEENRVQRGVPNVLPPLSKVAKNDRLSLAEWTTRPNHPLTSRVAVNRIWQMLFGTGLVESSENFGTQGSQPTHPELLDFLARRFVDSGWDVKQLVKSIVLSATYRQDSRQSKNGKDPLNKLLARGPSSRMSAEMVRDTVLAASGLLNDAIGGSPVNPYQPAGIWSENNTMSPGFVQSKGKDLYRRSLYSTVKRTTPVPSMLLFDATSREACTIRRPSTNTPLQALVLLNDIQYVEAARALAQLVLQEPTTDERRIARAFARLAGRAPDAQEGKILLGTLKQQREEFKKDPEGAKKLVAMGESKADPAIPVDELAAMTVTVQTILNSDAVIWKR